ncbi:hypothetical protein CATMQ487_27120 [Sphaerotilus microaerophilus]|uniref:Uncharacterized protein n=1 Tax=Sphaerotilus microaerophilus TaxID=2914710 RepID=A0ABM7YMR7_9BURK|nr:hypothetical protein CATMQ487_27120 [Sphaerotilus sp. FB-5]
MAKEGLQFDGNVLRISDARTSLVDIAPTAQCEGGLPTHVGDGQGASANLRGCHGGTGPRHKEPARVCLVRTPRRSLS